MNQEHALRDKLRQLISEHKQKLIQEKLRLRSRHVAFVFEYFYHEHNIDAAMRSIEGCGFQDVYIIDSKKQGTESLTITKGADYWLSEYRYDQPAMQNTQVCFDVLRAQGYTLVGTTPHHKAYTPCDLPLVNKLAVVFGNERLGISDYALSQVDTFVTIPMYGFTESFNASVSAAIVAYELRKRLQQQTFNWQITQQEQFDLELTWLKRLVRGSEFM